MDLSDYVGIPFVSGGRTREGADCWGILRIVFHERLRILLPSRSDDYASTEDRAEVAAILAGGLQDWSQIDPAAARPLDGILMNTGGQPAHVGLYCGGGRLLHTERGTGSIIQPVDHIRVASRIAGYFRHESQT